MIQCMHKIERNEKMLKKILLAAAIFTSFNTVYAEEACYIKDENNV